MIKGSVSGSDLLEVPLWSVTPLEAMLLSVVHAAIQDHDEAQVPCGSSRFVLLIEDMLKFVGHDTDRPY